MTRCRSSTVEMWLPVPGFPGWMASSIGRLQTPERHMERGAKGCIVTGGTRTWGVVDPTRGLYRGVHYRGKRHPVHRMVCAAFWGPPPFDGAVVMHINEDAQDNTYGNLAWGTQKENLNAPGFRAKCAARMRADNPRRRRS